MCALFMYPFDREGILVKRCVDKTVARNDPRQKQKHEGWSLHAVAGQEKRNKIHALSRLVLVMYWSLGQEKAAIPISVYSSLRARMFR